MNAFRRATIEQINNLNPNDYLQVSAEDALKLNEKSLRTYLSTCNRARNINLKLHKENASGVWWIWHDPQPRKERAPLSPLVSEYVDTKQAYIRAKDAAEQSKLGNRVLELQLQLDVRARAKKRKSKGSTHIDDETAFQHLALTKEAWALIEPRDRQLLKIKAGTEIKKRELELEQEANANLEKLLAGEMNAPIEQASGVVVQAIEIPNQHETGKDSRFDSEILRLMGVGSEGYMVE